MTSTLIGLLLAASPAWITRVQLRTADEGDRFDPRHLTAALTLGDGDNDTEISEVEEYPAARLIVGRLSHPGDRPRNELAAVLLSHYFPPAANRWWLDIRGGVIITGLCQCGAPADLPNPVYDTARVVSALRGTR
ncbi:hypothetical protein HD597_006836 [Nonomuraea thailandensis]|uniref:Uncharacterized protein n=1 Tax=Nonomuraea thailandensis TaxID=1188745 RepID=A0A9X2K7I6_9ACTN|nr:hypothetical protein [Nonomuraea thailandensis]MCP2359816.1 hypothetical protein [Nonomuraea thailandensis]